MDIDTKNYIREMLTIVLFVFLILLIMAFLVATSYFITNPCHI